MDRLGFVALLLLAAASFPLSFWIARACLAGLLRVLERQPGR